jgi:hypothetical protein
MNTYSNNEWYSAVEIFFNWYDAATWIEGHLEDTDKEDWIIEQCSINLMPNGGYRAGFVRSKRQKSLEKFFE